MARDYSAYFRTGQQDAANVFTPVEDLPAFFTFVDAWMRGIDVEDRVVFSLRRSIMDFDDWQPQFEVERGHDPQYAYKRWASGFIEVATRMALRAIKEEARRQEREA